VALFNAALPPTRTTLFDFDPSQKPATAMIFLSYLLISLFMLVYHP
jgi:hypothetical protein